MREWTKEEKYRYLHDPQELLPLYEKIKKSEYRQIFHNQAVTGLMNDPNGFVWHDNKWHLFYQWCPWGAVHGLKHWYHIVSTDLVTWKNLGLCLIPDHGNGYDNKGVYSGSAMPIDDKIYLYYNMHLCMNCHEELCYRNTLYIYRSYSRTTLFLTLRTSIKVSVNQ